ncbi:YidB family protein [Enterovirga rhinocerotis]|uniref:Uncharacterized protein YidB (DUF937 family) n=1 Tax=Enterovirga rhinocerotis TaxID=1339210 RepID=A0A4R7CB55_9HYPH|nr:YidB family protein [Enterovirga rhinocerotis]TDR94655.1 uncharacterized protein YidB (DUF937 family) [Enterovirga rhinocerotis]
MGLLDQVLGQVIGGMAGQGGRAGGSAPGPSGSAGGLGDLLGQVLGGGQAAGRAGGAGAGGQAGGGLPPGPLGDLLGNVLRGGTGSPPPGAPQPQAPAPSGGGIGDALGGILSSAGGKYSPLVLALLAILANKNLSSGAGGFGSVLHDMFTGGRPGPRGGEEAPEGYAGDDGYRTPRGGMGAPMGYDEGPGYDAPPPGYGRRGGDGGGGFLDEIGSMLDGPGGQARAFAGGGSLQDLVGGGIDGLRQRFDQNGRADVFDSWVQPGPNHQPDPTDLDQAFGAGTIDELARRTGLSREDLLAQLGQALPQVIDGLTPGGRMPDPDEQRHWI